MATRVTPAEVKVIIETPLTDPAIQIWIDAANAIVDDNSDCITGGETILKLVELQLSAHFVGMQDSEVRGFITKDGLNGFETSYSNPVEKSKDLINSTTYGQAANMLAGGCLASTSEKTITFASLGGADDKCFDKTV